MKSGIINVYKEKGFTSFDVVAKLKGILKERKIGHTGTLDPDAEGVLPVCVAKGTKLCALLTDQDKEYEAVLLLGQVTDTQDCSGTILEEHPVTVSEAAVREAVQSFVGAYDQVPPMYSALKVNGKKLYELARKGMEVERAARRVTIHSIDILSVELPPGADAGATCCQSGRTLYPDTLPGHRREAGLRRLYGKFAAHPCGAL